MINQQLLEQQQLEVQNLANQILKANTLEKVHQIVEQNVSFDIPPEKYNLIRNRFAQDDYYIKSLLMKPYSDESFLNQKIYDQQVKPIDDIVALIPSVVALIPSDSDTLKIKGALQMIEGYIEDIKIKFGDSKFLQEIAKNVQSKSIQEIKQNIEAQKYTLKVAGRGELYKQVEQYHKLKIPQQQQVIKKVLNICSFEQLQQLLDDDFSQENYHKNQLYNTEDLSKIETFEDLSKITYLIKDNWEVIKQISQDIKDKYMVHCILNEAPEQKALSKNLSTTYFKLNKLSKQLSQDKLEKVESHIKKLFLSKITQNNLSCKKFIEYMKYVANFKDYIKNTNFLTDLQKIADLLSKISSSDNFKFSNEQEALKFQDAFKVNIKPETQCNYNYYNRIDIVETGKYYIYDFDELEGRFYRTSLSNFVFKCQDQLSELIGEVNFYNLTSKLYVGQLEKYKSLKTLNLKVINDEINKFQKPDIEELTLSNNFEKDKKLKTTFDKAKETNNPTLIINHLIEQRDAFEKDIDKNLQKLEQILERMAVNAPNPDCLQNILKGISGIDWDLADRIIRNIVVEKEIYNPGYNEYSTDQKLRVLQMIIGDNPEENINHEQQIQQVGDHQDNNNGGNLNQ